MRTMNASDAGIRLLIPKPTHQTLIMLQATEYAKSGRKPSIVQLLDDLLDEACEARGVNTPK